MIKFDYVLVLEVQKKFYFAGEVFFDFDGVLFCH